MKEMMGTLLGTEWIKLRRYRTFIVLLAFFLVSIFGINYIVYFNFAQNFSGMGAAGDVIGRPFDFPTVWQTVGFLSSFLLFIPGLVVILLMSNEYTFRTGRQNVIDGMSRSQFIDTKIALIFIIAAVMTLVVALTGLLFGAAGEAPLSPDGTKYLGYFFVNSVAYMSVALVIVLLLKRSGVSIGIYFLYMFVVENLIAVIVNHNVWAGAGNFLPLESSDRLIPMPTILGSAFSKFNDTDPAYLLLAACLWIAACLVFCKYRFQKSDL